MFFCKILLVASMLSSLCNFYVSSCDDHCADKPVFTPSRVVVKFGDGFTANCSICQHACLNRPSGLEVSRGDKNKTGTTAIWTVDKMDIWDTFAMCFYTPVIGDQCCSRLPVTVYQPPDNASFSFVNHTGPMFEGRKYTLQCSVQNVAPVENLIVTFYRGQTKLGSPQSKNSTVKEPVTEVFTLDIIPSKEDDGVQFWCDARLDLGPEGPEPPLAVESQNITTTVYFKPQLKESSDLDPITIMEGKPLQLNCSAVGNPTPSYTWKLPIMSTSPSNGSVLIINSVTSADEGLYTCTASNHVGTVTVNFNIVVQRLELIPTSLPPTTTSTTTPTTTPRTTPRTTPTTTPTHPTTASITPTTMTAKSQTAQNSSTSITLVHGVLLCFMLLFSALV